jgi:formylglycine-generating enzyme required for sulfatase activity
MRYTTKAGVSLITTAMSACCLWAVPNVSNVRMQQRKDSRLVDIRYDLADEPAYITLQIETNGVALPGGAVAVLTGDVSVRVQPGNDKHIVWHAGAAWPGNKTSAARANVTAWATNAPPFYMVVDLSGGTGAGSFPVRHYADAEALPDGGLTNDVYRTSRLVLRRIRTGAAFPENGWFLSGSNHREPGRYAAREDRHPVRLTKDYYLAIFETTQGQWTRVMGGNPSYYQNHPVCWETRPVERVSWRHVRMSADNSWNSAAQWPEKGHAVGDSSFMRVLRDKTGLGAFDLPTEMQWEYACRAATTRGLYWGGGAGSNLTNQTEDAQVNANMRYLYNGGQDNPYGTPLYWPDTVSWEYATAKAGSYAPNPWGLYDMLGNVFEWCLDNYSDALGHALAVDPSGVPTSAETGRMHTRRGGSIAIGGMGCRSGYRGSGIDTGTSIDTGFRVAFNLD